MFKVIRHIIRKEFIQVFRDKRMIAPLFLAPVIQLILFGYAATVDIKNITLAAVDDDHSQESRAFLTTFTRSGYFELAAAPASTSGLDDLLQAGKVQAGIVIPERFAKRLQGGESSPVQVIIDGADANTATIIMNYIDLISARFSESVIREAMAGRSGGLPRFEPRIWFNPELKSSFWMVPGVICMILLITTMMLTSMAITRERELGTLEQLIVSPIKPRELILGKTIPFAAIGFFDILLVLTAGKVVFDVPIRGSVPFLLGSSFLFILTTLGMGLFISTISRTQGQAMMSTMFFVMPAMLLSGIFSPIENMPRLIRYVTYLNPLRYFGKIVREILLKGNGPAILWPELLFLLVFGVTTIVLSSLRFRKNLE
ncbi:MAG: ABC transporter permease [Candidatus Aminicenantales bacterium]|jgi:ABC-2 type transport system permease protein